MRVLVAGIDTLYLGVYLALRQPLLERLGEVRETLKIAGGTAPHVLAGIVHDVGFGGRGWAYRLACDRWTILLQPRNSGDPAPPCQVQFRSQELWAEGPRVAAENFLLYVAPEIGLRVEKCIVSRVDLTCDWDGWTPVPEDRTGFVRRSRYAVAQMQEDHRVRESGELPVARAAAILRDEDNERYFKEHGLGVRFTGWSFGKGSLACRLYDKTAEIEVSHKTWFEEVWQRPIDDEEGPVWRCEFQVGREPLKQFGIDTINDLWLYVPRLWGALAGRRCQDPGEVELWSQGVLEDEPEPRETGWLTLRTPARGMTRSRWPVRPEWRELQESAFPLAGHPLIRNRRRKMDRERTRSVVVRGLVRLAVLDDAPLAVFASGETLLEWARQSEMIRLYCHENDTDLVEIAEEFRRRL